MSNKREADNEGDAAPMEKKPKQQEAEAEPVVDKPVVVVDEKIQALEEAYRLALAAFKADKTNKDLRRARSAAKKVWDAAVLASTTAGEPLTCKDCSQMFLFLERELYDEKGWTHSPSRCTKCNELFTARLKDRTKRDASGDNMCYDFQRGECTRGNRCRFSHDPKHAGSASKIPVKPVCFAFKRGHCKLGDECRFRHEVEETGIKNKQTTTSDTQTTTEASE